MKVYHADLYEAQADPALAALFAPGPGVTPFDRLDWLQAMSELCLAPARCMIAVARDGDAICALPLCERRDGFGALANWYSFVARPRFTDAAAAPPMLAAIMRSLARWGALDLAPLPRVEAAMMRDAARAAGWIARIDGCDRNHVLHPDGGDFAAWWATRPGALRETVRRKAGKVTVRIAATFDPADWDAYAAIYAQSWKPVEGSPQFLRRFAMAEGAAGRLRLGLAYVDGAAVAAQLWTIEDRTAFIHKLAHNRAAAAHSPGTVLSHAMFAQAIDCDHVTTIDFGTGDDAYKHDWMDAVRLRYRLKAIHPRAVRRWPALARLLARALVRLPAPDVADMA